MLLNIRYDDISFSYKEKLLNVPKGMGNPGELVIVSYPRPSLTLMGYAKLGEVVAATPSEECWTLLVNRPFVAKRAVHKDLLYPYPYNKGCYSVSEGSVLEQAIIKAIQDNRQLEFEVSINILNSSISFEDLKMETEPISDSFTNDDFLKEARIIKSKSSLKKWLSTEIDEDEDEDEDQDMLDAIFLWEIQGIRRSLNGTGMDDFEDMDELDDFEDMDEFDDFEDLDELDDFEDMDELDDFEDMDELDDFEDLDDDNPWVGFKKNEGFKLFDWEDEDNA